MTTFSSRRAVTVAALACSTLLAACSNTTTPSAAAPFTGTPGSIAVVNGQAISRADFERRIDASPIAKQTLSQLIQGVLIDQYATQHHIIIPQASIEKKLGEIRAKYPSGQFDVLLANQGFTIDDVKRFLRQQLVLEQAVGNNIKISDSDVSSYFAKNAAQFDQSEQVHARHILVADLKTADEVEGQIKGGAKFEDLAKKYSNDPSSKDKGGDLGFFGRKQMVPSFEEAAFSQPINVVGPPVKSPFGYHIIEVLERKPAVKATLANSSDAIRKQLRQQQMSTQIPSFMAELKSKAKIEISDPGLKEVGNVTSISGGQ